MKALEYWEEWRRRQSQAIPAGPWPLISSAPFALVRPVVNVYGNMSDYYRRYRRGYTGPLNPCANLTGALARIAKRLKAGV